MNFHQHPAVYGSHFYRLPDDCDPGPNLDFPVKPDNILGIQMEAAVADFSANAEGTAGAVNQ